MRKMSRLVGTGYQAALASDAQPRPPGPDWSTNLPITNSGIRNVHSGCDRRAERVRARESADWRNFQRAAHPADRSAGALPRRVGELALGANPERQSRT